MPVSVPHIGRQFLSVVVSCAMLLGAVFIGRAIYYDTVVGPKLERQLGFSLDTPLIATGEGGDAREVAELSHVTGEGVLGRAGFRRGDVLADLHPHEFYTSLERAVDGKVMEVMILRTNGGAELDQYRPVTIRLVVE